jgi:hypothetical protein
LQSKHKSPLRALRIRACHHCGKESHYRRSYKDYLAIMKAKKLIEASASCEFMIE